MKKFLLPLLLLFVVKANAQLLSWKPNFIQESSLNDTIILDANLGNQALWNHSPTTDVYVHIGVITSLSTSGGDWKYVKFTWGTTTTAAQCTYLGNNKWRYTISGGLRSFFGITNTGETIKKIAILFRNGSGSKVQRNRDGSDMYVPVYDNGLYTRIDEPFMQPTYNPIAEPVTKNIGDAVAITMKASKSSALSILYNGTQIATGSDTVLSKSQTITVGGPQIIIAKAVNGGTTVYDTTDFIVTPTVPVADLPAGVTDGINYEAGGISVVLVLYAPLKNYIYVQGDFNNWETSSTSLMNVTPDKQRFWLRITGLTPGTEYAYQYLIDGSLKIADYNCEKILDPDNDQYISSSTYPGLKPYPTGKTTGIVSILQTNKPAYSWQVTNFSKPNKQNLVIYELLMRDFTDARNYQTMIDTLSYLQRLGVNAIEVMPFNEFEGNDSWGYNPSYYFAPDKYYGTENKLKQFIDECHKRGIAVIMDIVLNHTYWAPTAAMYWDGINNRPAANSPWYNAVNPGAFGFGNDFNHESAATKDLFNRVLKHWIVNYKIDGYRLDFSKGLTQKHTTTDAEFSAYDASRIAILNGYASTIHSVDANAYVILEHFCDNTEEKELSDVNGMMLWGNQNYSYNQATMGYKDGWDFNWGIYKSRGWAQPNLITYQESHDEERLMYKNEQYGASGGSYNVKTLATGLARNGMAAAFWAMQPGPKLLWEFGELGYDLSINRCSDGTINNDCRLTPKPPHWEYYNDANRKALYDVYADLIHLKTYAPYSATFISGTPAYNLSDTVKWQSLSGANLQVMVYGNFGVYSKSTTVTFPSTGTWYNYLGSGSINVASTAYAVTLQPGEYYVYTNKDIKDEVLAVDWLSFSAQKNGSRSVLLSWSTKSDVNEDRYEVERSSDGVTFTKIASVRAIAGSDVQRYSITDNAALNGISYYRLKQVNKDGSYQYSSVQKIDIEAVVKRWSLYPNPAKNNTALYALHNYDKAAISISDLNGRIVYRINASNIVAGQQFAVPVQQLSKGVYVIKIITGDTVDVQKLVVN